MIISRFCSPIAYGLFLLPIALRLLPVIFIEQIDQKDQTNEIDEIDALCFVKDKDLTPCSHGRKYQDPNPISRFLFYCENL